MSALNEITNNIPDSVIYGDGDNVEITSMTMDTRSVQEGALFCCVRGASRDGHDFVEDAISSGAVALLVEKKLDVSVPQVVVPSVRETMGIIADRLFARPSSDIPVFGITGTNGKTTTTYLLRAILEAAGKRCGVIGTTGTIIGGEKRETSFTTPEAIDLHHTLREIVEANDQAAAIEVSSHAIDQHRIKGVRFAAIAFTNLTRDHLDYHRSFEAYFQAKRQLFVEKGPEGQHWPAVINCDDEWGARLFDELVHSERDEVPVWGWTMREMNRASVSASYALTPTGASIKVESPIGDFTLISRLRGRFNVENVLTAATMALLFGLTVEDIQAGLDNIAGVPGRFEAIDEGQPFTVLVDYAHTPDSLEQVLNSARQICDQKLLTVFGCGGDRDRSKRPIMGSIAAKIADIAIVTSDNPRSEDPQKILTEIRKGTRRGSAEIVELVDRREAIEYAIRSAEPGDVVVVAGKGHEQGQTFANETLPFDDASVVREALKTVGVS